MGAGAGRGDRRDRGRSRARALARGCPQCPNRDPGGSGRGDRRRVLDVRPRPARRRPSPHDSDLGLVRGAARQHAPPGRRDRDGRTVHLFTEFGIVGKIGVNDAGLGLHFNILHHRDDGRGAGVPVHVVARRILDEAATVEEATAIARSATVSASTVLTVVAWDDERASARCLELSPAGVGVLEPDADGVLAHTNHFLDPRLARGELRDRLRRHDPQPASTRSAAGSRRVAFSGRCRAPAPRARRSRERDLLPRRRRSAARRALGDAGDDRARRRQRPRPRPSRRAVRSDRIRLDRRLIERRG